MIERDQGDGGEASHVEVPALNVAMEHPYLRREATSVPRRALLFGAGALIIAVVLAVAAPGFFLRWPGISSSLMLFPAFLLLYHRGLRWPAFGVATVLVVLFGMDAYAVATGAAPVDAGTVFLTAFAVAAFSVVAWLAWWGHQRRMHELAETLAVDPDTELPRSWVFDWYMETAERAAERGEPVCLVLLELGEFDEKGSRLSPERWRWFHAKLADLLRLETRGEDVVTEKTEGRFAVLLRGQDLESGEGAVRRLAMLAREMQAEDGASPQISAGLADHESAREADHGLMKAAERALHSAQYGGGNQTVVFGSQQYRQIVD